MSEPTSDPDAVPDDVVPPRRPDESDRERAEEIYEDVGAENPDPTTRREVIELGLEDEGMSAEGDKLGEHNE